MSGLGLLGSMVAGAAGGAAESKLDQLRAEAQKAREDSLLNLRHQYAIAESDHDNANVMARDKDKRDNEVAYMNDDLSRALTGAEYNQLSPEEQAGFTRIEALNAQMAMAKNKADIARLNREGKTGAGNKDTIKYNDDGSFTVYNPDTRTARTVHTRESAAAKASRDTEEWAAKEGEGLLNFEPSDEEKKNHYDQVYSQLMDNSGQPTGGGLQPGQVVEQDGQLYQIGADGKSAVPYNQIAANSDSGVSSKKNDEKKDEDDDKKDRKKKGSTRRERRQEEPEGIDMASLKKDGSRYERRRS